MTLGRTVWWSALLLLSVAPAASFELPGPTDSIALFDDGSGVVVWRDIDVVMAQRFDSDGNLEGDPILVGRWLGSVEQVELETDPGLVDTDGCQSSFCFGVTTFPSGFAVTWIDAQTAVKKIWLKTYDRSGEPLGPESLVATDVEPGVVGVSQNRLASSALGTIVVVWFEITSQHPDTFAIRARLFDYTGSPLGAKFFVDEPNGQHSQAPVVTMRPDGRFAVLWRASPPAEWRARRFNSDGTPFGPTVWISPFTELSPLNLLLLPTGDYMAFTGRPQNSSIAFARTLSATTLEVGDLIEFDIGWILVWPYETSRVRIIVDRGSRALLIVGVCTGDIDPEEHSLCIRGFSADGGPVSETVSFPSGCSDPGCYTTLVLADSAIGEEPHICVAWNRVHWPNLPTFSGAFVTSPVVFIDGFESGDTRAWSTTTN